MGTGAVQYFTVVTGATLEADKTVKKILHNEVQQLKEVFTEEESDVILIFCPVVSWTECDIKAALQNPEVPDCKPVILVVLHHTFNPECIVPDSSRWVTRENTLTVDCLFYEDKGLLRCCKNKEALFKITDWLKMKEKESPEAQIKRLKQENTELRRELKRKNKQLEEKDALLFQMNKLDTLEKDLHDMGTKLEYITTLQVEHNERHDRDRRIFEEILQATAQCMSKLQTEVTTVRQDVLMHEKEKTQYSDRKRHSMEGIPPFMKEKTQYPERKCHSMEGIPPFMSGGSSSSEPPAPASELRLVLLGRTGCGKRVAGNTILGTEERSQVGVSTVRQQSESRQGEVAGRQVTVVDTPDWFCPGFSLEELRQDVGLCVRLSAPGPHTFLLVISVKQSTGEERGMLEKMEEIFGERCWRNTMILFTDTEEAQEKNIEEFVQSGNQEVQRLLEKCGNRFHCLSIKESGDSSQISELLEKIVMMVEGNREKFYSSEIYLETESQIRVMEKKIKMEIEEKRLQAEKELKEKLDSEMQNSLSLMESVFQEHEAYFRHLYSQIAELEMKITAERDENKKRETEAELKNEREQMIQMEQKINRMKAKTMRDWTEIEKRHSQEMEEIREIYEREAKMEVGRSLMKIILPELQRSILASNSKKLEEFSRQMEEKDRELESIRQRLSETTVVDSPLKKSYETAFQCNSERKGMTTEIDRASMMLSCFCRK